ncbi:MAG TPA: class I SAM-dependent methyltransferase [Rhizomicrobium sp.]|nr:class I SAM-dependent methyltransferase [Rhizomicrobium sp.]
MDNNETYGRHVVERFLRSLPPVQTAVELGAGPGHDLATVRRVFPNCQRIAVEGSSAFINSRLTTNAETIRIANIERDELPVTPGSVDLVIANQVLEHTKEVFWIFDQVFRSLKVGGHFIVGVPNVASFHNRLLLLAGIQPTQHKLYSAHVRPFSKADTIKFLSVCFPGCSVISFKGSQFYPFPRFAARFLAAAFPTLAFSIFFLIRKDAVYNGEFAAYPVKANLETNFWCGPNSGSQYEGAQP